MRGRPHKPKERQRCSDDDISVMLKNRIADALGKKNIDVATLVQVTNAFAKLRGVELKQDEGDYGDDLTAVETQPLDMGGGNSELTRDPPGRERSA